MKKILTGFLGLFVVLGLVAGAGYALFSDTAEMTGVVLGTATPNLQITLPGWSNWHDSLNGPDFTGLLPGEYEMSSFWLRNESNGSTHDLDFTLKATMSSVNTGYDWDDLKGVIKARICVYHDSYAYKCKTNQTTGWHTLQEWKNNSYSMNDQLDQGEQTQYVINYLIPASEGPAIEGKTVQGITFEFTGTQVP